MIKNRLKELDSLRGLAAVSVVFFHFTGGRPEFDSFFKFGGTAVNFFFMISGFVIFLTVTNSPSWDIFVKKRILRLYPTYWICLTITTIAILFNNYYLAINNKGLLIKFIANLTMFQSYMKIEDIDGPYWTLAIEFMFYILIAFILISNMLSKIEVIGYLIIVLIVVLQFYVLPNWPLSYHRINRAMPLIIHWPLFFAGILFYKQKNEKETFIRYISIIVCFILSIWVFKKSSRTADFVSIYEYIIILLVYFLIFFLLIKDRLKFLQVRFLLFLGDISYTLYLVHQYVGRDVILSYLINIYKINFWVSCFIAVLFSIILSSAITYYLDVRVRHWLDKYIFLSRSSK